MMVVPRNRQISIGQDEKQDPRKEEKSESAKEVRSKPQTETIPAYSFYQYDVILLQVLMQWVKTTSVKGAGKVVNSKSLCQRVLWLLALMGGIALAAWMTILLFQTFMQHDIIIRQIESSEIQPFPDVSICNLNPVGMEKIQENYTQYFNDILWPAIQRSTPFENLGDMLSNIDYNDTFQELLMDLTHVTGFLQNVDPSYDDSINEILETFVSSCSLKPWPHLVNQDSDFLDRLDHDLNLQCSHNTTRYFFDQTYGPCMTMQLDQDDVRKFQSLTSVFYLQDVTTFSGVRIEASPDVTYGSGLAVLVHEHGTLPVMKHALRVPVGFETTINVDVTRRQRLEAPYETCEECETLESDTDFKYTRDSCLEMCVQRSILNECGCLGYFSAISPQLRRDNQFCAKIFTNLNQTRVNLECSYFSEAEACNCPSMCDEYIYTTRVSQTIWPQKFSLFPAFYTYAMHQIADWERFMVENTTRFVDGNDYDIPYPDYDMFRSNFLQVNIVLPKMNTTVVKSKPALSAVAIIGSLGGILNLWIGKIKLKIKSKTFDWKCCCWFQGSIW